MKISYNEFLSFLKENDCLEQFIAAFYEQNGCTYMDERLWDIMEADECFFNQAFTWSKTREGRTYWLRIDDLWSEKFRKR